MSVASIECVKERENKRNGKGRRDKEVDSLQTSIERMIFEQQTKRRRDDGWRGDVDDVDDIEIITLTVSTELGERGFNLRLQDGQTWNDDTGQRSGPEHGSWPLTQRRMNSADTAPFVDITIETRNLKKQTKRNQIKCSKLVFSLTTFGFSCNRSKRQA